MRSSPVLGFALGAVATAAAGAACLAAWVAGREAAVVSWASIGFVAMAVPGIVGGSWLAVEHGRPGARFLVALATGFVTRLVLAAVSAFAAAKAGGSAGFGLICGLAAGFAPLTAFETVWFALRPRASGPEAETRA